MSMNVSSEARESVKAAVSWESRAAKVMGKVLMALAEPLTSKIINHLFVRVGANGVVDARWTEDLKGDKDAAHRLPL